MGERLGDYELLEPLAHGGMGEVFLARSARHGTVALKRMLPHLAKDAAFARRFLEEAGLAARVHHPNVVRTLELGEAQGTFFIAMEHVDGLDLRRALARGPLAWPVAVQVAALAARGLHAAHRATDARGAPLHIVHADVSPHNVLLSRAGAVKLIDFGVARAVTQAHRAELLLGKYSYLSPEQAEELPLEPRSDEFSLAVVLWEALTGQKLFDAGNDAAILQKVLDCQVTPPSRVHAHLPRALDAVVLRALSAEPTRRYPTLLAFEEALTEVLALAPEPADLAAAVRDRLAR